MRSFNYSTDTATFVYQSSLLGVAEASSHELGHTLGLSHDGTSSTPYYLGHGSGEASWAPLMGAGYYEDVTQWSADEYYDSNNAGSGANFGDGPDDLLIMTTQFGFGYRVDDHGDNSVAASGLSGTSVSESGVIERTSDVDVFQFSTGAGTVSLTIEPDPFRPNLNVKATLRDSDGNQVAVSDPTSMLSASFNLSLTAGTYYLEVEGTGTGNPMSSSPTGYTEYATLGQYTVTGTLTTPADNVAPTASFTHSVRDLTANFTDTSSDSDGTLASWSWDFGDGNTSTSQNPSNTYATAGTYTVGLTVADDHGAIDSTSKTVTVTDLQPPVAPTGLTATIEQSGKGKKNKVVIGVTLSWTDNSENETSFVVEGCKEEVTGKGKKNRNVTCEFVEVGSVGANVTSFEVDLSGGDDHFRVKAENDAGSSDPSSTVKI